MVELKLDIPKEFYKEEVRCDYTVNSKMKEVWAVELDLLMELDRICQKHNITYYASGGTVLGAIRHNGFIPWDDDIDVMMLRDDYKKICEVAEYEFKRPYFFQTDYTDNGSIRGHAQLRNSDTTAILSAEYPYRNKLQFNQGIFLDIFPLDNIPDDKTERGKYQEEIKKLQKNFHRYRDIYYGINLSHGIKKAFKEIFIACDNIFYKEYDNKDYRKFENYIQSYDQMKTEDVACAIFSENYWFKKCFLGKPSYHKFEFLKIPVPEFAEEYLTANYGDWHKFVKNGSIHQGVMFDTDKSYIDYIKEH